VGSSCARQNRSVWGIGCLGRRGRRDYGVEVKPQDLFGVWMLAQGLCDGGAFGTDLRPYVSVVRCGRGVGGYAVHSGVCSATRRVGIRNPQHMLSSRNKREYQMVPLDIMLCNIREDADISMTTANSGRFWFAFSSRFDILALFPFPSPWCFQVLGQGD
jgi:hypothetical protein